MKNSKGAKARPRARIIMKMLLSVDATGPQPIAYPDVFLLADEAGWRKLATMCLKRANKARRAPPGARTIDPEDHAHFAWEMGVDERLSDRIEIRLGTIRDEDWAAIKRNYWISARTARRGSGAKWLAELASRAAELEKERW